MIRTKTSAEKTPKISRAIKKAMIDMDIGFDQIGGSGVRRTWAWRVRNPGRLTLEDFVYLLDRLQMSAAILDDPKVRKELIPK